MSERPVAIVTGGSVGIGAAICRRMLDAGYDVVSLARRKPDWSHPALHAVEVDLHRCQARREEAAASLVKQFAVGTVVHNAGMIRPNLLADVRQEDLHDLDPASSRRSAPHRAGGVAGHARAEVRPHRADIVAGGARTADTDRLFRHQGRHDRHGANLGARTCTVRNHGERRGAWSDPGYRNVRAGGPRRQRARGGAGASNSRSAGSGAATMSHAPSCSLPTRKIRSSPGRFSTSAAAPASPVSAFRKATR